MSKEAKVTINSAVPRDTAVVESGGEQAITDARGRVLVLREPDVLAPYRLVEILGPSAENRVYMGMLFPLLYLKSLDGDPIPPAANKLQLEGLIQRLGHDGVKALRAGVEKHFSVADEKEENAAVKK